jgi:hypothetical protein
MATISVINPPPTYTVDLSKALQPTEVDATWIKGAATPSYSDGTLTLTYPDATDGSLDNGNGSVGYIKLDDALIADLKLTKKCEISITGTALPVANWRAFLALNSANNYNAHGDFGGGNNVDFTALSGTHTIENINPDRLGYIMFARRAVAGAILTITEIKITPKL